MADAVYWQILEAVQDGLQDDLTFAAQGSDTVPTIASAAIVIRKLPYMDPDRKDEDYQRHDRMPGIIISPAGQVQRPAREGTNARDDVTYPVLCQIIDKDHKERLNNLRTYLKWQEQIAKYFNSQTLLDVQGAAGCVHIGQAVETDTVNESLWVKHRMFVAGVELYFKSREPRGVSS